MLLWGGIDRDLQNEDGDTALHVAVKQNSQDVVWLLLENGAEGSKLIKNNEKIKRGKRRNGE